ncbi:Hypothetical protein Minf_0587 [Methylacidiphilum infernorum V4]|uniref:Uncharacterized protein n=1 Tax=Methylacidiphilum infernorum (isolate V4) TaxID=481448 RepID=B3DZY4_METI4|nr:Hypothetical protein Minf_0587 [Methylacidiphilum infernorum V4]
MKTQMFFALLLAFSPVLTTLSLRGKEPIFSQAQNKRHGPPFKGFHRG